MHSFSSQVGSGSERHCLFCRDETTNRRTDRRTDDFGNNRRNRLLLMSPKKLKRQLSQTDSVSAGIADFRGKFLVKNTETRIRWFHFKKLVSKIYFDTISSTSVYYSGGSRSLLNECHCPVHLNCAVNLVDDSLSLSTYRTQRVCSQLLQSSIRVR